MSIIQLKKLQNGSDIRGVALEGISEEPITLSENEAYLFGMAFACWLDTKRESKLKIAIGHDSRLTANVLKDGFIRGVNKYMPNATLFDCGLSSTPAMFMSTIFPQFKCDGAVMITASHLPYNRNGFKFFNKNGGLDKRDISKIIELAEEFKDKNSFGIEHVSSISQKSDLIGTYSAHLADIIKKGINSNDNYNKPLQGLKIIVDAGNGAGGFYATNVLAPLGADITGSQFLEPDGTFPNHIPNPEDKDAMDSICSAVKANNAHLGLIFDTDVDRSSAVDGNGSEISRNAIIALAAALVAEEHAGTTIVTDSITSDELTHFIERELSCIHHRYKRGYKNVINESIRMNEQGIDSQLAIETSGHAALKENYFLDDGAYLATKIVVKTAKLLKEGKTIDSLIGKLNHPLESKEIRIKIKLEDGFDFATYGDKVISDFEMFAHVSPGMRVIMPNHEGARIAFDKANGDGWSLLRKSLHDPIMPLNIESRIEGGCKVMEDIIFEFLKQFPKLEL